MRKNFRSDISIRESFYDYDQSGERIQSLVPENVRIEYFTPAYPRVRLVCSRNGDTFHNCSLSENGRVLVCNLALSRKSLGVGPLLKIVKHSVADSSFPYDLQNKEHIASTGIDLWGGPSDAGELESESVLSEVILRYGYSAYRLAVLDGFEGTEQEWLESLIGDEGKSAYQVAVDNGFDGTVAEWLASLVGAPGKSAYQVAVDNGFEGTEQEWLESLIGDEGKSAYQVAVDNGFEGTVSEWLASLVGPVGPTPNITIGTVETGNPGTDAEVHIAGTAAAPVLSFKIPRGQPGVAEVCYKHVASLPTASADTMSALYLVDTATTNVYDVYYTSFDGTTYSWVQLGTSEVQLTNYATKDEIEGNLMTARSKNALIALFQKVAYIEADVTAEIDELENALFNLDELVGITAVYTQGNKVIWSDGVSTLNDLKPDLVVKAVYGNGSEVVVTNYTLSGTLTTGTSTILVTYEGFTATFNVTVTKFGTKMSYTMSLGELSMLTGAAVGGTSIPTAKRVQTTNLSRQFFYLSYGLQKVKRDSDNNVLDAYPVPVPPTATRVTATITPNTNDVAISSGYLSNGEYYNKPDGSGGGSTINPGWWQGSGSLDLTDYTEGRDRLFLYVTSKLHSGGNYSTSNKPTNLVITFE